jgi:hypothetical protein
MLEWYSIATIPRRGREPDLANQWDASMKMLVRANPQALVSLLLPGAKFQGEQDKELKARIVKADLLYNVR